MPTSTLPSSATSTDLSIPRSVIGLWISGSETVARAAWMASSSGAVMAAPGYATSVRQPRAALDEGQDSFLEQQRIDRFDQIVVGARVACFLLDPDPGGAGEQHQRQRCGPGL